eukprot:6189260-Pleurochrysis_carterae.AAC.1
MEYRDKKGAASGKRCETDISHVRALLHAVVMQGLSCNAQRSMLLRACTCTCKLRRRRVRVSTLHRQKPTTALPDDGCKVHERTAATASDRPVALSIRHPMEEAESQCSRIGGDFSPSAEHWHIFDDVFALQEKTWPVNDAVATHFEDELYPDLSRGVYVSSLLLHIRGQASGRLDPKCAVAPTKGGEKCAASEADYSLSIPATRLNTFVSHCQSDSSMGKWFALAFFFRARTSLQRFLVFAVLSCVAQLLGWVPPGLLGPRLILTYTHVAVKMAPVASGKLSTPAVLD